MRDMVSSGILVKEETNYFLSDRWVMETCITMERIKIRQKVRPVFNKFNKGIEIHTFKSYSEMISFMNSYMDYFIDNCDPSKKNEMCWISDHAMLAIVNMQTQVNRVQRMKKHNVEFYSAVSGKTLLDEFNRTIYDFIGLKNAITGIKNPFGMIVGVSNNIALCLIVPPEVNKKIEEIYQRTEKTENLRNLSKPIAEITNYLNSLNAEIKIMITTDPIIVKMYKDYIINLFDQI